MLGFFYANVINKCEIQMCKDCEHLFVVQMWD